MRTMIDDILETPPSEPEVHEETEEEVFTRAAEILGVTPERIGYIASRASSYVEREFNTYKIEDDLPDPEVK